MSTVTNFPEPPEAPSIIGPERGGNAVIVDERVIPQLHCYDRGEEVELVLDGRFSITVPKPACDVAWLVASALAIGAGYSHLGAETRDRPFAPKAMKIDMGRLHPST